MTRFRLLTVVLPWSALLAAGCGGHAEPAASPAAETHAADLHASPEAVVVSDEMRASLTVAPIAERETTTLLTIAGKVQFDEDRLARVLVPLSGQIVDLRVKVGDIVSKGQALCAVNSREAAAAVGEHIESHKDLELAEKTAAMTEDLFRHDAASKIALQQAQSDLAKAQSKLARTEQALRALGLDDDHQFASFTGRVPIPAPIAGIVIERKVTEGQFVQSDSTPVITIADLSTVWVMGDLFERDLHLVTVGQPATITTAAYPGEQFVGRVNHISEVIDPTTRTAKVRISVPNARGRLKSEMFATIALDVAAATKVVMLSSRAIFTEDGRTFAYVESGAGQFVRRAIDVAPGEGAERRVLGGLHAGDRVVVDGALLLRQEENKRGG
ncbi:MAG: efflux RND transporter periplasmic adaptor subunit [Acidobacteria bacterium]|nr:efflux RND transporter periplasmic adaptor subunit [Acidobacteriota bacterium]